MVASRSQLKAILKRGLPVFVIVILAIALQFIEHPYQRVAGNMCDGPTGWCYESGWKLGLPFAWVWGSKVSAYVGSTREGMFIVDVLLCSALLFLGYLLSRKVILNRANV